ncbi:MAG: class 1 fructose-bisphosphatase [Roseiarcus sp.]|jgi:fructose-1,6-bisphosphatase I
MTKFETMGQDLSEFLSRHAAPELARVVNAFAEAAIPVAHLIRRGRLAGAMDAAVGAANPDGDEQKALDLFADKAFEQGLRGCGVRALVSEERHAPTIVDPEGKLLVALDPLDGSSNIDSNISIGSIFSVLDAPAGDGAREEDFLQPGNRQRAAGFTLYGPQVCLVFTTGAGTHVATLDPDTGTFRMSRLNLHIRDGSAEFAINASNSRHWPEPVRAYVDDCVLGEEGPRGKNFNMRWTASMVADAYRIIVRGGVYLYPDDARAGYAKGRLRLLYEADPISMLVEQAGGLATDGVNRILDIAPTSIHARTPFIFGSTDKVERVKRYFLYGDHSAERSPLFGKRGLLRN